jgi:hypothetical protein
MPAPEPKQRFNHVAMSLPSKQLEAKGRKQLVEFYSDVFGWQEHEMMSRDGELLVLGVHSVDQFVFLVADDEPMKAPHLDHFGVSVGSMEEMVAIQKKAFEHQQRELSVSCTGVLTSEHDGIGLKIHSIYVGYKLPMLVEVQYWEWTKA